jgi:hypothetical protein
VAGHGYAVAEYYVRALAGKGLPAPLLFTRLLLLLGDALDSMPREEAMEAAAFRLCESWCRDSVNPEACIDECMADEVAKMERYVRERESRAQP